MNNKDKDVNGEDVNNKNENVNDSVMSLKVNM